MLLLYAFKRIFNCSLNLFFPLSCKYAKLTEILNRNCLFYFSQTSEEFKQTTESKLSTAEREVAQYKSQVSSLQSLNQDLNAVKARITREAESQTRSLREMLSKVRAELDEALKKAQTSASAEMTAKEELKEQAILAAEVGLTMRSRSNMITTEFSSHPSFQNSD